MASRERERPERETSQELRSLTLPARRNLEGGRTMFRAILRTPRRRLAWLILLTALAWAAWAVWPPTPEARWTLPAEEASNYGFTPDGRMVFTVTQAWKSNPAIPRPPWQTGPLVGRDAET